MLWLKIFLFADPIGGNLVLKTGTVTIAPSSAGTILSGNDSGDQEVRVDFGDVGAGELLTIKFQVTVRNPLPANVQFVQNQGTVQTDSLANAVLTDDPEIDGDSNPTTTLIDAEIEVTVTLNDYLFIDADQDEEISLGDTLFYRLTVVNSGNIAADGVSVEGIPDANTTLVVGSALTNRGTPTIGNNAGDTNTKFDIGQVPGNGGRVTISYWVELTTINGVSHLSHQASVFLNDPITGDTIIIRSDDPDTPTGSDPTITPISEDQSLLPIPSQFIYMPLINS